MADEAVLLCGTNFRLHGRDPKTGLDCIGLADFCMSAAGVNCEIPTGYSIRGGDIDTIARFMEQAGFEQVCEDAPCDGDIVLVQPSSAQFHFMICIQDGFIHAHASLRKVVFSPGPCPWPVLQIFRIMES
ncbi:MAG: hypothetical protein Pars2KO_24410 [Parasphingorhabdus sp.]